MLSLDQTEFPNAPQVVMMMKELDIDTKNINKELEEQPGKLFYWDGLATEAKREASLFETIEYGKYMAHARNFARMYMQFTKLKDTMDNQKDTVILLYSKSTTSANRRKYAETCFNYSLTTEIDAVKIEELKSNKEEWDKRFKAFYVDMYKDILKDAPCFWEDVETKMEDVKQKRSLVDAMAEAYSQRGICLTSIASNARAANDVDSLRLLDKKVK